MSIDRISSDAHLFIISIAWPGKRSGGELAVRASLEAYSKIYTNICFIGITNSEILLTDKTDFKNVKFHHLKRKRSSLLRRFLKSFVSKIPASLNYAYKREYIDRILYIIKKENPENTKFACIFECIAPTVLLSSIRKETNPSICIYHSHDVLHEAFSVFAKTGSILKRLAWKLECHKIRNIEKAAIQSSDYLWAISQDDCERYEKLFSKTPDGILGVSIKTQYNQKHRIKVSQNIICLGTADIRKSHGLIQFIEGPWKEILSLYPKAKLHLGGRNTEAFHDEKLNIYGYGIIDDENNFLNKGALFLNPQQAGTGIKLKSLNAMASGHLLVTTPNGAMGTGGRHNEHLIICEESTDFVSEICSIFSEPHKYELIRQNGFELIETCFSQERLTNNLKKLVKPFTLN